MYLHFINFLSVFIPKDGSAIKSDYRVTLVINTSLAARGLFDPVGVIAEDICYNITTKFPNMKNLSGVCQTPMFVPVDGYAFAVVHLDFAQFYIMTSEFIEFLKGFMDKELRKVLKIVEVSVEPLLAQPTLLTGDVLVTFGGFWNKTSSYRLKPSLSVCYQIRECIRGIALPLYLFVKCGELVTDSYKRSHAQFTLRLDKDEMIFKNLYINNEDWAAKVMRAVASPNCRIKTMDIRSVTVKVVERELGEVKADLMAHFFGEVYNNSMPLNWSESLYDPLNPYTLNITQKLCINIIEKLIATDVGFSRMGIYCMNSSYVKSTNGTYGDLQMYFPQIGLLKSGVFGTLNGFYDKLLYAVANSSGFLTIKVDKISLVPNEEPYKAIPENVTVVYWGYLTSNSLLSKKEYNELFKLLCEEVRTGMGAVYGDLYFLSGNCLNMTTVLREGRTWVDLRYDYPKSIVQQAGLAYDWYNFLDRLEEIQYMAAAEGYFADFNVTFIYNKDIDMLR